MDDGDDAIHGMIDHLGLSSKEASVLIGLPVKAIVSGFSRRSYAPPAAAKQKLTTLAGRVDAFVAAELSEVERRCLKDSSGEPRLLIYRNDEDLPPWVDLPFASVHRVAMARVAARLHEQHASLVVFEPGSYRAWLRERDDNPDNRSAWAARVFHGQKFYFKLDGKFLNSALAHRGDELPRTRARRRRVQRGRVALPAVDPEGTSRDHRL
jgi:hypothetical protein